MCSGKLGKGKAGGRGGGGAKRKLERNGLTSVAQKVSVFRVFLVRVFPHSGWIQRDTEYFSIFSPNTGKHGPEKLRIRTFFTQCCNKDSDFVR